jgi:hypothetical protein
VNQPSNNPYDAPRAPVKDMTPVKPAPIKGLLIGLLIDIGGSIVLGFVILFVYLTYMAANGSPMDVASTEHLMAQFQESNLGIVSTLFGGLLSVLGGYVCARIAKQDTMRLGWIMAALSTFIGLAMSYSSYSVGKNILMTCLTFASVSLGYYWGRKKN